MEKKHSSCPLQACEKMFKAIASSSPFRRRISHYPQDPVSANHAPNSSPPTSIPVPIIHDSPHHSNPVESAQRHKPPENIEATEAVPVKFKHSGLPTHSPVQKNGKVANNIAPKVKSLLKTKPKAEMSEPENHVIRKGRAQPGNTAMSNHGQVVIVSSRIEPEPPVVSQKNKTYAAESNKSGANPEEGFTNFINHAKSKIRNTSSNLGDGYKGTTTSSIGDGKMVPGEDTTSKDHFSDYINRAKHKMMRTMSSFGGGRSNSMK